MRILQGLTDIFLKIDIDLLDWSDAGLVVKDCFSSLFYGKWYFGVIFFWICCCSNKWKWLVEVRLQP